jgi:hypothetical protein
VYGSPSCWWEASSAPQSSAPSHRIQVSPTSVPQRQIHHFSRLQE